MKICLECEGITDADRAECASCHAPLFDTSAVHFPLRRGEADAANPLLGSVVDGKYLVQGVLGKGGMGTVFRALHQVSLVPVALKILNPRLSVRGEYRDYFLAEAQKAGRVTHEHAGRVLDVGVADDGTVYIAMEEVDGITLHDCIHGPRPLEPVHVVEILEQICEGLMAAHQAGLVHRDLSPRNVMVEVRDGHPHVKILDFGIAKGMPRTARPDADAGPRAFANPPYTAPEQLEGRDVDARADLYSLGVIAFEALTRRLPVRGDDARELAQATLAGELEPLPAIAGVPARLSRLVRGLLAVDREDRPDSAEDVARTLHAISQPSSRWLQNVAVVVFLAALVFLGWTYVEAPAPFLALRPSALTLHSSLAQAEVQHLRTTDLATLRFEFGGFAAHRLHVEASSEGQRLFGSALAADSALGVLLLDRGSNAVYREFLEKLDAATRGGEPAIVTFLIPGAPPLGVAQVVLDDAPPLPTLARVEGEGPLRQGSHLKIHCVEVGGLARLDLLCFVGQTVKAVPLLGRDLNAAFPVEELLRDIHAAPETEPLRRVGLCVAATDKAGNAARSARQDFDVDLRAPEIRPPVDVAAFYVEDGRSRLHLEVSGRDEGLALRVRRLGADGAWLRLSARPISGTQLEVELPRGFVAGEYDLRLADWAGNETSGRLRITLHTRRAEFEFLRTEPDSPRLHPIGDGLAWSGEDVQFVFRCNDLYRPKRVTARGAPAAAGLQVEMVGPGETGTGRVRLARGESVNAEVDLVFEMVRTGLTPQVEEFTWRLFVRSDPLRLRIPDAQGIRFYRELVSRDGLLAESTPGTLRQGSAWQLAPADSRLLRGSLLWGSREEDLTAYELPVATHASDPLFHPRPALRGVNLVGLRLEDVFGRPVVVVAGDHPAPHMGAGGGGGGVKIASFTYHPVVARRPPDALVLESGQPTRVTLHSDYGFEESDRSRIQLAFQESPLRCVALRPGERGTDLVFEVPFDLMKLASRRTPVELRRGGVKFTVVFLLSTPAGELRLADVPVETIRSSLAAVTLGGRFPQLQGPLAAIRMVPVVGPLTTFDDRVPRGERENGRYLRRQTLDVKRLQDCFLQDREISRAEYQAVLQAFLGLPARARPEPEALLFPGDPAGAKRLTEDGMRPVVGGDGAGAAPMTGVSFYQAFTLARMAGVVITGDADTFRLPFGAEMEYAALASAPIGVLNAQGGRKLSDLEAQDVVDSGRGAIRGLDFGVREWVQDLPWPVGDERQAEQQIAAGILSDHETHMEAAVRFDDKVRSAGLRAHFSRIGVVRGVTIPELRSERAATAEGELDAAVPGVVRTLHVQRSGEGLHRERLLSRIGFRLAGGKSFVEGVRVR